MTDESSILGRVGAPPDRMLRYGDDPDQVADLRMAHEDSSRPLIVLLHGGFWKPEYDRAHTGPTASALAVAGWTVLTVEYRRIPGDPDATLHDIATAIDILPRQTKHLDLRVILLGHSAGGHLALWAAAMKKIRGLAGVVALAPTADLVLCEQLHLGGDAVHAFLGTAAAHRPDIDPMLLPAPTAPVTIVHGKADEIVPAAVSRSYRNHFPATDLIELAGADHYALIDPWSTAWASVVDALEGIASGARHLGEPRD